MALVFNISGLRWVGKTSDLKNLSCQIGFVLRGRTLSWFRGFSEDVVKYRFLRSCLFCIFAEDDISGTWRDRICCMLPSYPFW